MTVQKVVILITFDFDFNWRGIVGETYQRRKIKSDRRVKENFQSLKRDLDELPDSTRKKIIDTIRKALRD
jgi:hypothetical protein